MYVRMSKTEKKKVKKIKKANRKITGRNFKFMSKKELYSFWIFFSNWKRGQKSLEIENYKKIQCILYFH